MLSQGSIICLVELRPAFVYEGQLVVHSLVWWWGVVGVCCVCCVGGAAELFAT